MMTQKWNSIAGVFLASVFLSGISVAQAAPPETITIGGTVSGLVSGSTMALLNNGKDTVTVGKNGSFVFPGRLASGSRYDVSVGTQPAKLRCIVQNGSGTIHGASITNVVVTCPMAFQNNLVWMRCSHGQVWNTSRGDCSGTGVANSYGAERLRYCLSNDTRCNGGTNTGALTSASPVFAACEALNAGAGTYGITTWRVPEKDELRGLVVCSDGTPTPLNDYGTDPYKCGYRRPGYVNGSYRAPTLDNSLFPNTMSLEYWTATSAEKQASSAWNTAFQNGWTSLAVKSGQSYLRCVSQP